MYLYRPVIQTFYIKFDKRVSLFNIIVEFFFLSTNIEYILLKMTHRDRLLKFGSFLPPYK